MGEIMSTKENKELMRKAFDEFNTTNGDIAKLRSLYVRYCKPTFIAHSVLRGDANSETVIQAMAKNFAAFPDFKIIADDMLAEGDKVVTKYTIQGTHSGTFMGIAGNGKKLNIKGVQIDKIVDGKRVENWDFPDALGLLTQVGAIPAPKI
jgi:predicted ester cyclase